MVFSGRGHDDFVVALLVHTLGAKVNCFWQVVGRFLWNFFFACVLAGFEKLNKCIFWFGGFFLKIFILQEIKKEKKQFHKIS
jgi:hypothetical protein